MNLTYLLSVMLVLLSSGSQAQTDGIEQFSWMLGSWKGNTDEGELYESWGKQDEFTLIGKGYYSKRGHYY